MFFTKEQISKLEKYRKNFSTAVHSGFARNVGSIALKEIEEIYDEANGSHYSYNSGCGVCVLSFIKKVGEIFLRESALYKEQEAQQPEEETPDVHMKDGTITFNFDRALKEEEETAKPKKKTTRRKKDDTSN